MSDTLDKFYKKQSIVYKYVIYFISIALIVFFFPKGGKFKYEFQKGKPWQYENLYAPFDFSIVKTDKDIALERKNLETNKSDYYTFDEQVYREEIENYNNNFEASFSLDGSLSSERKKSLQYIGLSLIHISEPTRPY